MFLPSKRSGAMNRATVVAVILLAAVAIGHVFRIAFGVPVTVADQVVPMWASWVGCVVAGGLAIALWRTGRTNR
jgi:protein-S-isoprenylcysteine O-methyltransferase Ste14